jgi:hypothetical protein
LSQNSHQEPSFKVHISSGQGLEQELPYPIEILIAKVSIDNESFLEVLFRQSAQGQTGCKSVLLAENPLLHAAVKFT